MTAAQPRKIRNLSVDINQWWMPHQLADVALSAGLKRFVFSKGERQVLRRRNPIPISQWTERHRHVRMSSIPGKWHNLFTPYLKGVMDTAGYPGVETVILCKTPQTGGSEAGHNIIGYAIDRAPGPAMYVFPDENTARENAKDRIIPMIEDSPRLREYLTGYGDDVASLRINLANMPIYLGWSGSVARLGNKPIRYLILDELDKYKNVKNEATSESLAEKRTTTWGRRKTIFKLSTPTTKDGPIWVALTTEANCIFDYWVRCPVCGHMQLMSLDRIVWSERRKKELIGKLSDETSPEEVQDTNKEEFDPEDVLARRLARYYCEKKCCVWEDHDRDKAVRSGEWRERKTGLELYTYLKLHQPMKVGFHLPSWLSYFISLSEVAHAFIKWAKSNHPEDGKNLNNQYCATPWEPKFEKREESSLISLCDDRPRGIVPTPEQFSTPEVPRQPIACLLGSVDTQGTYFRYVIRAYTYGSAESSWLVQQGSVNTFDDLDQLFWGSEYVDASGRVYKVRAAMIDAMGNRTPAVYRYAIKRRGRVYPFQGVQHLATPVVLSPQEYFSNEVGSKIKIPGGLMLYRCDITYFKSDLANHLSVHPDDPGAFRLYSNDKGELGEYIKEMSAEVWSDEDNCWINPHERPNHYWDCEVMQKALCWQLGVRNWKNPESEDNKRPKKPEPRRHQPMSAGDLLGRLRR
ncbi:phage terminase large subunit family protein [Desulfosarcina sp. OttesenSCG-928-A07]|nr:phage terminase large subunit family protein [Desulfosarcina sp. OttesenSCG-928-G17]MDL2329074.1 phage terminase large subunit family protein [Desulfosarcina sp. OttesenSCG-928-A07]